MINTLTALSLSLSLYLILSISYYGWGKVFARMLKILTEPGLSGFALVWLGWAFSLFILQVLHLFLPITAYVALPLFLTGVLFSTQDLLKAIRSNFFQRMKGWGNMLILLGLAVVIVWVALHSMLPPKDYDSGLYHFQTIRWINSYPIVRGLANLYGPLAYNQSFFLYAAALNFFPFFNQGRAIANSYLFILTVATLVNNLYPAMKQPASILRAHPFKYLPSLFSLPFLGYIALSSTGFASPTSDLASTLLQVVMFIYLLSAIAEWLNGERNLNGYATLVTVLAVTSVTVKLSNSAFAAVVLLFVLAYLWQTRQSFQQLSRGTLRIFLPVMVLMLVYSLRSILLSGAPLFPSTVGYIPVEWAAPKEYILETANWVYSNGRDPYRHWSEVLGNWNWLKPWIIRNISAPIFKYNVVYPLLLAILFLIAAFFLAVVKKSSRLKILELAVLLPVLSALLYWFFVAPNPRFTNALFFLLTLSAILLFLAALQNSTKPRFFAALLCITLLLGNMHYEQFAVGWNYSFSKISTSGYQAIEEAPLEKNKADSNLWVYVPIGTDRCLDAPLPCAPYLTPSLALREPGNLGSGFMLKK